MAYFVNKHQSSLFYVEWSYDHVLLCIEDKFCHVENDIIGVLLFPASNIENEAKGCLMVGSVWCFFLCLQ